MINLSSIIMKDHSLFTLINSHWISPILDEVMPFITHARNTFLLLALVAIFLIYRHRWYGVKAIAACLLAVGLTDVVAAKLIKPSVGRSRPEYTLSNVRLLVPHQGSPSFPSNHAGNCFAAAVTLGFFFPSLSGVALFVALMVAYSRVYVGVHFPLDVMGGMLLGWIMALLVYKVFSAQRRMARTRK